MSEPDRPPRILIVDDEELNRELLDSLLRPEGYEPIHADSGEEALARVAQGDIDLVLLDVLMPGLDGFETCRRIRSDLAQPLLPVVFVTALGDRTARVRGKEVGADDYLTKPVDDLELRARVRNLLRAKAWLDLRERQQQAVAEELERTRTQLLRAERLSTLGTLAAGVGHELRNIHAAFHGMKDFLRERANHGHLPDEEDFATLDRIDDHLGMHARQLLRLGSAEDATLEAIDLGEVLRGTLELLRLAGKTKYVEIEADIPLEPMRLRANRTRLEQVVVNLVTNGVDATEERHGRRGHINVRLERRDSRARCTIADNGVGIPPERLEEIFDPYFTTKPAGKGTGLGLPVVKAIVEGYEGRISVESRVGEGATFTFELPLDA